jgi:NAD(P)H-binding
MLRLHQRGLDARLVTGGHAVRLLVRDPRRIAAALAPLGLPPLDLDTIVGDVTDPAAVDQAVRGCEAVVHAGSVYSFDSRDAGRIRQVNVRGTDLVLGTAHRAGLDPIVYVSSIVALLPSNGRTLIPDSPAGIPLGPYLGSKAEAERVARRYREAGAPVVITYPGGVLGPHDPHLGAGLRRLRNLLRAATRSRLRAAMRPWMCAMWPRCMPSPWRCYPGAMPPHQAPNSGCPKQRPSGRLGNEGPATAAAPPPRSAQQASRTRVRNQRRMTHAYHRFRDGSSGGHLLDDARLCTDQHPTFRSTPSTPLDRR